MEDNNLELSNEEFDSLLEEEESYNMFNYSDDLIDSNDADPEDDIKDESINKFLKEEGIIVSDNEVEEKTVEPVDIVETQPIVEETKENEIEKQDNAKIFCISCNKEIPANSKFCPFCGTQAEAKLKPGFCQKCNNQNPEEAKFCGFCGNNLK